MVNEADGRRAVLLRRQYEATVLCWIDDVVQHRREPRHNVLLQVMDSLCIVHLDSRPA